MKSVRNTLVVSGGHARIGGSGEGRRATVAPLGCKLASVLLLLGTTLAGVAYSQNPTGQNPTGQNAPAERPGAESALPYSARTEFAAPEVPAPGPVREDFDLFEPSEGFHDEDPADATVPGVVVPAVTEVPHGEAPQWARLAGLPFVVGVYYVAPDRWRDDIRPDRFHLQSLPAGRIVPAGTPLAAWKLVKAESSRRRLTMPSLHGLTRREASSRLKSLGLPLLEPASGRPDHLLRTEDPTDGQAVIAQYPPAGRELFEGTAVFLTLAEEELPGLSPPDIPARDVSD
jgi:hypothetical protein